MSRKPENQFITSINRYLPVGKPYYLKLNVLYTGGVADSWYSSVNADLWVEFKFWPSLPVRPNTAVTLGLTELQLKWLRDRHNEGRDVRVIGGHHDGGIILTSPVGWESTFTRARILELTITRRALAEYIYKVTTGEDKLP